jgi:hypothetical protein
MYWVYLCSVQRHRQDISASNFSRAEQLNVSKNMILLRNNP